MLTELYRDTRLVIVDKPAGLPVHAGPRGGPSVEDGFPSLTRKPHGPWLVHRLDADTSGCLAIALTKTALITAQAAFASGQVRKTYWALTANMPAEPAGTISAPLRKRTTKAGWRMVVDPTGDAAISDYTTLAAAPGLTLLEIRPRTGRTHQVRVHCAAIGCPILNDPVYGAPPSRASPAGTLALLARALHLPLDPPISSTAPLPPHMAAIIAANVDLAQAAAKFRNARTIPQHANS
jgi:tRNA pseudouridine32 synthase/23S rRNA pseudouridine746 synthase